MSVPDPRAELEARIAAQLEVVADIHRFLERFVEHELPVDGRTIKSGLVVAGVLESYYTAVETILFRIVQEFGNELEPNRWHAELLERVGIEVPGVRPRVVGRDTLGRLDELRRFRHFKRYYFQIEYDWDKLDFLVRKQAEVHPLVIRDIEEFRRFLGAL